MPVRTALLGVLPPLLIAAAVLLLSRLLARRLGAKHQAAAHAFALALAYAVTDTLVAGRGPGFPPAEPHRWVPYLGLAAALLIAAWSLLTAAPHAPAAPSSRPSRAAAIRAPLCFLIAATGASVAFMQTHSAFIAQMSGAIAAAMGVYLLLALAKPGWNIADGVCLTFAVLIAGLIYAMRPTRVLTAITTASIIAGALSPLLGILPGIRRLPPWLLTGLCALTTIAASIAAVWGSPSGFDFSPE